MALGPKDLGELTEEDKKMVEVIEGIVDKYLTAKYDAQTIFTVPLEGIKDIRNKVVREIVARYTRAGWGEVELKLTMNVHQLVLKIYKSTGMDER